MGSHDRYILRVQLVEQFGTTRDSWMERDLDGWLEANDMYTGMPELLQHALTHDTVYIVTTKQVKQSPTCLVMNKSTKDSIPDLLQTSPPRR